jgi:NADPH:quinone reductase-like Zn-dependent oxidoreductase
VRLGVVLPIGSGSVAGASKRIEAAGFDSAWVVDAHNRGLLLQDPFVALALAASHTTRLEVGSCVIQAPLRHPFDLAERALTVHLVAEGALRPHIAVEAPWTDIAEVAQELIERRFPGKAVLHLDGA